MKKFIQLIVACLLIFSQSIDQSFAGEKNALQNFINSLGTQIISVASNNKINTKKKKEQLANVIEQNVDIEWIAKFVLGRHYRIATTSQKDQFKNLYYQFIIESYVPKFIEYNGAKFRIANVLNDSNYDVVKCIFNLKDNANDINLDFRVRENSSNPKQKFLVFDFIAEGVSFIETQRSEFGSVIAQDGLDKFLIDLAQKIKQLKKTKLKGRFCDSLTKINGNDQDCQI